MMILVWNMPTSTLDDTYSALLTVMFVSWATFTPIFTLVRYSRPRRRVRGRTR